MHKLLCLLKNNASKGSFKAEDNTIFLYDIIVSSDEEAAWFGGVSAESFVAALRDMSGPVALRINSPGGDVFGARVMANAIREYDGEVTAHVDGLAASAATFLTSVADKTVMAEGSMLMVHKAWSFAIGNSDDFRHQAGILDKLDGTIADTYVAAAERRGVTDAPDFAAMMAEETWLTASEAIQNGLADEEVKAKKGKASASASIRWDLSAYEHPPVASDVVVEIVAPEVVPDVVVEEEPVAPIDNSDIERRRRFADALFKTAA